MLGMSDRRLLLFDIDGTLIASGGAGEWALRDAMKTRFGIEEDLGGILLAGATDKKIAVAMLEKHGLEGTKNCRSNTDGRRQYCSDN